MSAAPEPPARVQLAHEPDFWLGEMLVCPSSCRIGTGDREQRVEPRVMEVLVVLARAPGRTFTRDELIEACWEGRFVGDDAVRRVIGRIRDLPRGFDPAPFVVETVPKVGFRLVLSEAADTPTDAAIGDRPPPPPPWRRLAVLAAVLALAAVVAAAVWRFTAAGFGAPPDQNGRVQVVRFQPLQDDPDLQRLSISLGDALVRMLTAVGVQVTGPPAPRDSDGAASVAELRIAGTVDRDGAKYVVNSQVLDRRSGRVIWSERFDRSTTDAAGVQEEAAARVGHALRCALDRRRFEGKAMRLEVLGLLMNACVAAREGEPLLLDATARLVQAAPQLSSAHSFRAIALGRWASRRDASPEDIRAMRTAARASAARALKLNDRNGEAYVAMALSYSPGERWAERERDLQRARELRPELPSARNLYVDLLREVGRLGEARELTESSADSDPTQAAQRVRLATLVAAEGDLPSAYRLLDEAQLVAAEGAKTSREAISFWWDDPARARALLERTDRAEAIASEITCQTIYLDRLVRAEGTPIKGLPEACAHFSVDWRVRMLARQGDIDGAYREVSRPWPNSRRHTMYLFYPELKAFRRDPRFMPFAARLGLVDYWTRTNRWPDFCAEPDLPYDCRAVAKTLPRPQP